MSVNFDWRVHYVGGGGEDNPPKIWAEYADGTRVDCKPIWRGNTWDYVLDAPGDVALDGKGVDAAVPVVAERACRKPKDYKAWRTWLAKKYESVGVSAPPVSSMGGGAASTIAAAAAAFHEATHDPDNKSVPSRLHLIKEWNKYAQEEGLLS